jgi:hypothetical protein
MKNTFPIVKKTDSLPTAKEMKAFALMLTSGEWDAVCKRQDFLDVFTIDLNQASLVVRQILT